MDIILYILCGLSAGLLAGYLGLGGGIVMVPYLTIVTGLDFKTAVPVSVSAIMVNSLAASNEYLKKGMVDIEMVIVLSLFMVIGNITGSNLSQVIPSDFIRLVFTVLLIYTALSLLKDKKKSEQISFSDNRMKMFFITVVISFFTGILAGLLGIGGGVILVPVLYLVVGLPLTTARGTSSLMVGFSAAAAATVYFLNGMIDYMVVAPVITGVVIGGKLGGYLGTIAKPKIVKIIFVCVMLYLAFKLGYEPLMEIL